MRTPNLPEPSPDDRITIGPLTEDMVIPPGWTEGHGDEGQRFAWRYRGEPGGTA
jgi:hypothetical protein